jgi:branched-chain amino acid transport system substrate-binding protein
MLHRVNARRLTVVAAAALLLVAGCGGGGGSSGDPAGEYVIGLSSDLSGPFAVNGVPATAGVNAAVIEINNAGGVNGRKVKLIIRDDASDVNRGSANLREFTAQKASAVVGTVSSAVIAAQAPLLQQSKLPLVGIGVPSNLLSPVQPYVYMADASYEQQAQAQVQMAKQLSDNGSLKGPLSVSAIHLATPAGEAWLKAVRAAASAAGVTVAEAQSVQPTAASYASQMGRVKQAGSNVVLTFVSSPGITAAVNAMRELSMSEDTYVVNFDITTNANFLKQLKWNNFLTLATFDVIKLATDPKYEALRKAFSEYQGGDYKIIAGVTGYASARLVLDAFKSCGYPCDGEKLQAKLDQLKTDLNGLAFTDSGFSKDSHAAVNSAQFVKWDAGKDAFASVGPVLELNAS